MSDRLLPMTEDEVIAALGHSVEEAPPKRCADVTFDMRDGTYGQPSYEAELGDLLWNPKAGDGHVLVREARCNASRRREPGEQPVDCGCGGWVGACDAMVLVCECGEDDSWRDHHYEMLGRAGPPVI